MDGWNLGVALEQETFFGLSGLRPKRLLAPSLIYFRGNPGFFFAHGNGPLHPIRLAHSSLGEAPPPQLHHAWHGRNPGIRALYKQLGSQTLCLFHTPSTPPPKFDTIPTGFNTIGFWCPGDWPGLPVLREVLAQRSSGAKEPQGSKT